MTDLEDGFYWVRRRKVWQIASFEFGVFWMAGDMCEYDSEWFDEIDPRRIVREGGE